MIGIARKAGIVAAALTVGILVGMTPARADHFHGGGGHWDGGHGGHWGGGVHWGVGIGFGGVYDPWWGYPAYYGPAYYPPPPVYYVPAYAPTYANPADSAPPAGYTSAPAASQSAAPAAFDQSDCHPYQSSVVINGAAQPATGEACRQPDGTWRIVH